MKIVIAPDSFKGALSAPDAARAIAEGVRRVLPEADTVELPIADGGEGTLEALVAATGGTLHTEIVTGPLGKPLSARWGSLGNRETAVVELAEAAGLTQVPLKQRDPKHTTTAGVGELVLAAYRQGFRRFIVGLGGSATNDGGSGLLTALGVRFTEASGLPLAPGGAGLRQLEAVDFSDLLLDPAAVELLIACDVDNPLLGPRGASAVFGPQKGAGTEDIALLDSALARYAEKMNTDPNLPGAGAAGGTAYGLLALFPQAALRPGIDLVLDAVGFDARLLDTDLILTGEGRLDSQTLGGKAVAGVARRAKAAGVPVGVLAGSIGNDVSGATLAQAGIGAVLPLAPGPCSLPDSIAHTAEWLTDATERALRWMFLRPPKID